MRKTNVFWMVSRIVCVNCNCTECRVEIRSYLLMNWKLAMLGFSREKNIEGGGA